MIGRTISHYEVLEKVGEGGMGVVYKARDTQLNRFVALKVLPADTAVDPERRARFLQEAQAASALNHPGIVTVHAVLADDDADAIWNTEARWSPDGEWIAFDADIDGNRDVYVIPSEGGAPRRLTTAPGNDWTQGWSGDGRWIHFTARRDGREGSWRVPRDGGEDAVEIAPLRPASYSGRGLSLTPDGRRLLCTQCDREGSDLMLVENFH